MSSTLEDRLTAALHARADLVQPEDLRPPAPPRNVRRLPRRAVILAAAAVIAVVGTVAVVVLRGEDLPAPADRPMPDGYVEVGRATGDVDGDGRDDLVRLGKAEGKTSSILIADVADRRVTTELADGPVPTLVGLVDVDQAGQAIVTKHPDGENFELAIRVLDKDKLSRLRPDEDDDLADLASGEYDLGYAITNGLTTWVLDDGRDPAKLQRPLVNVWTVASGRLVRTGLRDRCWHFGEPLPTACPAVDSVPSEGGYVPGLRVQTDLDGDGTADEVRVSWPRSDILGPDNSPEGTILSTNRAVIVATLSSGGRTGQYLPPTVEPGELHALRWPTAGGGEVPVVAVTTAYDDAGRTPPVFRLVDGVLTELSVVKGTPVDPYGYPFDGEFVTATWFVDGRLQSARGRFRTENLPDEVPVDAYDYRVDGAGLVPVRRLGKWCSDPRGDGPPSAC